MRCGIRRIPQGNSCKSPGIFNEGCLYEVGWESLALPDGNTDATLKYVPRSGIQRVVGFIVDTIQPVQAATGPGAGPLEGQAAFMTALTVNGISYMPQLSGSVGAALSSQYALAAFSREKYLQVGDVMAALDQGGVPWAQFGVHMIRLGINDDVTVTISNQTGLAADLGGTFVVYQEAYGEDGMPTGGSLRLTSATSPSSAVP